MSGLCYRFQVPGDDYSRAGEASSTVKNRLKRLGVSPEAIRRVSIALYEGEINMVIHAGGGCAQVDIFPDRVEARLQDEGPGIADVEKAMQPMYTTGDPEERAGLGFAVMQSFMDKVHVSSRPGRGTRVTLTKRLDTRR